jgi:hypothetical protein
MQYLCLVYVQPSTFAELTPEEHLALDQASLAHDEDLQRSGHLILASALQEPETAITVRHRGGAVSTTTGPFAETVEHLGGFLFLVARDLNEAVAIASRAPIARYATLEVRPLLDLAARVEERQRSETR